MIETGLHHQLRVDRWSKEAMQQVRFVVSQPRSISKTEAELEAISHVYGVLSPFLGAWFKVSVSAADSAGTETDRSRRFGSDSDDTRKTLHRTPKKL